MRDMFELGSDTQFMRLSNLLHSSIYVKGEGRILEALADAQRVLEKNKLAMDVQKNIAELIERLEKKYTDENQKIELLDAIMLEKTSEKWRQKNKDGIG